MVLINQNPEIKCRILHSVYSKITSITQKFFIDLNDVSIFKPKVIIFLVNLKKQKYVNFLYILFLYIWYNSILQYRLYSMTSLRSAPLHSTQLYPMPKKSQFNILIMKKNPKTIYINVIFPNPGIFIKVFFAYVFCKNTDFRSPLINFLCSSPVYHSHLAKTVYMYLQKFRILAKWEDTISTVLTVGQNFRLHVNQSIT